MTTCLDSWAVLRWLSGEEPARGAVEAAMALRPLMSWINLGEVAYVLERASGAEAVGPVIRQLRRQLSLELPGPERVLQAAAIKARFGMAYADAFAVATALAHEAELLTGDPEILERGDPSWPTVDLRG